MIKNRTVKKCNYCGKLIYAHEKRCPFCNKTQRIYVLGKILGIYVFFVCFILFFSALSSEEQNQQQTETGEYIHNTFEYADINITYIKSEINYNSRDEKRLFVYFEMTNNSSENRAFDYLVVCKTFQNGIELDNNYVYDSEEEKNGSREIQPGATITVAEVFELGENMENVTLEIRPFNIWSDKLLFEKEIQITE